MKNADDIRTESIALLVEKLREIGTEADRECRRHREAEKSSAALADFHTFADHREGAALNYALAYRCEQLCEEITGALLFDELDAQDEAAEQAAREAETKSVAGVKSGPEFVEHVDYAEAEAVREIEREMAIEAGDDSEIDQLAAQDAADAERWAEENAANQYDDEHYNTDDDEGGVL